MRINITDWDNVKVIDRASDNMGRLIKEVIWIRKTYNLEFSPSSTPNVYQP